MAKPSPGLVQVWSKTGSLESVLGRSGARIWQVWSGLVPRSGRSRIWVRKGSDLGPVWCQVWQVWQEVWPGTWAGSGRSGQIAGGSRKVPKMGRFWVPERGGQKSAIFAKIPGLSRFSKKPKKSQKSIVSRASVRLAEKRGQNFDWQKSAKKCKFRGNLSLAPEVSVLDMPGHPESSFP